MKITTILGAFAVAIIFFFGLIFALAASVEQTATRLTISLILFATGTGLVYIIYVSTRQPTKIIQQLEISGRMKAASIRCPNCSASVNANQIKIVSGVPYATCPYCGTVFEVVEEPKW
jgi:DNA-directed RNA polymerase subunit RPC12/RpoP